jgi:hypothetical protein
MHRRRGCAGSDGAGDGTGHRRLVAGDVCFIVGVVVGEALEADSALRGVHLQRGDCEHRRDAARAWAAQFSGRHRRARKVQKVTSASM